MPVPLRGDFDADALRVIARKTKDGPQGAASVGSGGDLRGGDPDRSRRIGGVTLQIGRDWVVKLNAHGPEGLIDRKPPGQPSKLTDVHRPCQRQACRNLVRR